MFMLHLYHYLHRACARTWRNVMHIVKWSARRKRLGEVNKRGNGFSGCYRILLVGHRKTGSSQYRIHRRRSHPTVVHASNEQPQVGPNATPVRRRSTTVKRSCGREYHS
ncbi:hypothetical protein B0H12DRAFT_1097276 [Mycena haematopus]|nr:hypothetical protein B0H12DRAFT_1097276 [Mycena haematopus]